MPRLIARLALAAVLLAGWQSALVHPLLHVDKNGGFVHLGGQQPKKTDVSGLCDVIAALAACASGSALVFVAVPSSYAFSQYVGGAPRTAEALPFLSQGPPVVL